MQVNEQDEKTMLYFDSISKSLGYQVCKVLGLQDVAFRSYFILLHFLEQHLSYLLFCPTFHTFDELGVAGFQFLLSALTFVVMATVTRPISITTVELHVTTSLVVTAQPLFIITVFLVRVCTLEFGQLISIATHTTLKTRIRWCCVISRFC